MAILEEVPDDEAPAVRSTTTAHCAQRPAVREVSQPQAAVKQEGAAAPLNMTPVNQAELMATLRILSARLALAADILPRFMRAESGKCISHYYRHRYDREVLKYLARATDTVDQISQVIEAESGSQLFGGLGVEEQAEVWGMLGRLQGDDAWSNADIRTVINGIPMPDPEAISLHILQHTIRPLFAPHPSLSAANRALSRPTGGSAAMSDLHDEKSQPFKAAAGWGSHNLLAICASRLPVSTLLDKIGLVLPPTLVLMDDWEPFWRLRGIRVLASWVDKMDADTMNRMGLGKLLVKSLIHTLSMHGSHEVPDPDNIAMRTTMKLIWRLWSGQERMELVEEVMEKGLIQGWLYSPSGQEGRVVGIKIARDLKVVIGYLGEGIVRWLKTIIPSLLQPLAFSPTPHSAEHLSANMSALHTVLLAVASTGRAARWRGLILDYTARLWAELLERERQDALFEQAEEEKGTTSAWVSELKDRVKDIVSTVSAQSPSVRDEEIAQLVAIDRGIFAPLAAAV